MPTDRLAAVALRVLAPFASALGPGDDDALQNINTTQLPNGSLCWVTGNRTLYVLEKDSTDAAAGESIIAPESGPGRWVALTGLGALAAQRMSIYTSAVPSIAPANPNEWFALPALPDGGPYAPQVTPGGALWTIGASTGICTYNGPTGIWHFDAVIAVSVDVEATEIIEATLSINGALIGSTTASEVFETTATSSVDDHQSLVLAKELALETGDTVQLILRNTTGDDNVLAGPFQMKGILVGLGPGVNASLPIT